MRSAHKFYGKVYKIKIKLNDGALIPKKQTQGSAGYDLHAHLKAPIKIAPGAIEIIPTGISLSLPKALEAQIRPRSGLTTKKIEVKFGTIDSDYRGEIKAIMQNNTQEACIIENGMRIAQLIFNWLPAVELEEVGELGASERGSGGLGSTGVF